MFDDRPGRGSSMQTYYRLSVCMVDASERGRPSLGLFRLYIEAMVDRGIHHRNAFYVYIHVCVYSSLLSSMLSPVF